MTSGSGMLPSGWYTLSRYCFILFLLGGTASHLLHERRAPESTSPAADPRTVQERSAYFPRGRSGKNLVFLIWSRPQGVCACLPGTGAQTGSARADLAPPSGSSPGGGVR